MNNFEIAFLAIFFAAVPILASVFVRDSVKHYRQIIIKDLAKFFTTRSSQPAEGLGQPTDIGAETDAGHDLLHSFEFVKFKYLLPVTRDGGSAEVVPDDFRMDQWAWMALPLFALLILGNILAIAVVIVSLHLCSENAIPNCLIDFLASHRAYRFALLASYLGAYSYTIRAFYQAINNFDLTPSSFLGAFNNLIFGVALPQVVFFTVSLMAVKSVLGIGALVITAFVGGYMPDAVLRFVMNSSLIRQFKEERFDYGERGKSTPVEVLDGIDSLIRFRLSDFHITTVQNLACANPIMLFVETPYGIYQMLDWVAQAQLCASVGPDRLFKLWDIGIRTIFDLERTLYQGFQDDALLKSIGRIILSKELADPTSQNWDKDSIIASIKTRVDCPYTRRLRQIFLRVSDQLGSESQTLRPGAIYTSPTP